MFTESIRAGEHVLSEAEGMRSRQAGVLGTGNLLPGTVLGRNSLGAASSTADADNTGNGTMSAVTVGSGATVGDYQVVYVSASGFEVEDPAGINLGTGENGVEFNGGGIAFTMTAGSVLFEAGDVFTVTLAKGTGEYKAFDPANTDGSDKAVAVLYAPVDASTTAQPCVAHVRDCEVHGEALTWPDVITPEQQAAAIESLANAGIAIR
jgi:hypothetical protein